MDSPTPKRKKKTPQTPDKVAAQAIDKAMEQAKAEPPTKKIGRPSKYTPEIAQEMCNRLANGEPLRQICRDEGFPAWQTVYDWMYRDDALGDAGVGLSRAIARARELGYDAIAEDCLIIADTPQLGQRQVMDDKGSTVTVEDMLGHRKLQIETRLKLLAKFNPKKYGDKLALGGDADNPLKAQVDISLFETLLTSLETRRQAKNG
jgi:hypothetical protein